MRAHRLLLLVCGLMLASLYATADVTITGNTSATWSISSPDISWNPVAFSTTLAPGKSSTVEIGTFVWDGNGGFPLPDFGTFTLDTTFSSPSGVGPAAFSGTAIASTFGAHGIETWSFDVSFNNPVGYTFGSGPDEFSMTIPSGISHGSGSCLTCGIPGSDTIELDATFSTPKGPSVPEPSSMLLVAAGVGALWRKRVGK